MANEVCPPAVPTGPVTPATPVNKGDVITKDKMNELVDQLQKLLNHTHIFYDDYGTACACNCNCNCTRGSL